MTEEIQSQMAPDEDASATRSGSPSKRSAKRNGAIIGIVTAAVIVAAGAAFLVWHEQPSFCNALCHVPMDTYVEGYCSEDPSLLSARHKAADIACLDCHVPNIAEQIGEGVTWVVGDYALPLEQRSFDDEFCLNSDCHQLTREDLEAKTSSYKYNPHSAYHETEIACGSCHKAHAPSVNRCTECHGSAEVPRYWEAFSPLS